MVRCWTCDQQAVGEVHGCHKAGLAFLGKVQPEISMGKKEEEEKKIPTSVRKYRGAGIAQW